MKIDKLREIDILYNDIENRIESIKTKKKRYTVLFILSKVIIILLGSIVTVLAGSIKVMSNPDCIQFVILIISASITAITATEGTFSFKEKGKSYDILLYELRRLRDRICYDYSIGLDNYEKNKKEHFIKFQEILDAQKVIIENSYRDED